MLPDDPIVGFFSKHMVPMLFSMRSASHKLQFAVTSFVLSVEDRWFLITAGHCLRDIQTRMTNDGYEITSCALVDSSGLGASFREPIPFAYMHAQPHHIIQGYELDYGVVPLSQYYRGLLEANKIEALNEEVWDKQPPRVEFYKLIGVPAQLSVAWEHAFQLITTLHEVEPLATIPPGLQPTNTPLFYGRIVLGAGLTDIQGMSGSPIFAFSDDPDRGLRYWLVAVQSHWIPSSGVIIGCPMRTLGQFLRSLITQS